MCEQEQYGFDCVCEHVKNNPGNIEYTCEFCGIYTADRPRCNKCETLTETMLQSTELQQAAIMCTMAKHNTDFTIAAGIFIFWFLLKKIW